LVLSVAPEPIGAPSSAALLRAYFTEIVSRYHGRPASDAEVDAAQQTEPSTDLAPPTGEFLVLRTDSRPSGCVGLRRQAPDLAELTRLFVHPNARGRRAGRRLVAAADETATAWGVRAIRLDTRNDLIEARTLYLSHGYAEIPAYNREPYAEHWFERVLRPSVR
jgi:GNAT superfamily N-acetyltransferase